MDFPLRPTSISIPGNLCVTIFMYSTADLFAWARSLLWQHWDFIRRKIDRYSAGKSLEFPGIESRNKVCGRCSEKQKSFIIAVGKWKCVEMLDVFRKYNFHIRNDWSALFQLIHSIAISIQKYFVIILIHMENYSLFSKFIHEFRLIEIDTFDN